MCAIVAEHGVAVVFWPITPCNVGRTYYVQLQDEQTLWCHNPEDQGMSFSLMELSTLTNRLHGNPMHNLTLSLSLSLSLSLWCNSPNQVQATLLLRFLDHTLDMHTQQDSSEQAISSSQRLLITQQTQETAIHALIEFEPETSETEGPQTYTLRKHSHQNWHLTGLVFHKIG